MRTKKRLFAILLVCVFLFALVACSPSEDAENGGEEGNGASTSPSGGSGWDYSSVKEDNEEAAQNISLDEAEVRLVYAEDSYLLLAYHGPQKEIGMHFCLKDGSSMSDAPDPYYWLMEDNWRLIQTDEVPEGYTFEDLGLSITDYSVDSEPKRLFSDFGEPISDDELKAMGVAFLEGHPCNITDTGRMTYSDDNFMFTVYFQWMAEDRNMSLRNWPFTVDDFQFYAEDGTPLGEVFEGYDLKVETFNYDGGALDVIFEVNDSNYDKARNEQMCDELRALKPYMIYTASDGSTLRFDLLTISW